MTEKEKLIEEIGNLVKKNVNGPSHKLSYTMKYWELELVSEFLLADRKRIVEPLIKFKNDMGGHTYNWRHQRLIPTDIIDETLKLAGVQ